MKKPAFLVLVLLTVFAIASCAEGEIDYALSFVSFTITNPDLEQTYGGTENCCAFISGNTLDLRAGKGNENFRLQIPLSGEGPYERVYQNCIASVNTGSGLYEGSVQTVTLMSVPDTAGEFVTGTFANGSVTLGGVTRTLSGGIIHLVFVNKAR